MVNYFRFGTNDAKEILLLKYGFSFEDIEILYDYVHSISEFEIVFKGTISELEGTSVMSLIERYL